MNNDIGISEEFEEFDDEKQFRRLTRSIEIARKYFLHFVCCNQIPRQNELIKQAIETLPDKKIEVITFKEPITDLLNELETKLKGKKSDAVFVQGLFHSISSDGKGKENQIIQNLNISRDSFRRFLDCPMFLWLPEYAIVKITRNAPDFFSVRSGTFYFSSSHEKVTEQIFQNVSSNWTKVSSLSVNEKQKRIKSLENLLGEYRGLPDEKRDKSVELKLLLNLGAIYFSVANYKIAIDYSEQALKISRELGDKHGECSHLGNLGTAFRNLGEYKIAIDYSEQALKISRELGDKHGESNILSSLGVSYENLGKNKKAIDYHELALKISRETGNKLSESNHLGNLGNVYFDLGEIKKAMEYYEKALKISSEIGYKFGKGSWFGNLGNAYDNLGENKKAIDYYTKALKISREIGDKQNEGNQLGNLGNTYDKLGEKKKALDYSKKAFEILEEIGSPNANVEKRRIELLKKKLQSE